MSLFKFKSNRIVNGHLHAWCLYTPTNWKHFVYLLMSIVVGKIMSAQSVTSHLPLELQHTDYPHIERGKRLIRTGQFLAALTQTKLYWENAPLFNYGTWDLKHGQTDWGLVPDDIPLCFDTGHAMLGTASADEARKVILIIFKSRQSQIKHLHIHENDLIHDIHARPDKIITKELLAEITKDRTYILEII